MSKLLEYKDFSIELRSLSGTYRLVEEINFSVDKGEVFGIVGESGCGKSITAASMMQLLATPPLHIADGKIIFEGKDIIQMSPKEMREITGNDITMIFQEPMTALDPLFTIGDQISEMLKIHTKLSKKERIAQSIEVLKQVGISRSDSIINEYPHQLSGGMLQRVMIAIAIINNPKLLIADEPTTALDVTIQAQILDLINQLIKEKDMSMIMITHDLGVIAETCDRVAVFYGGHMVEMADVQTILENQAHPYTKGLVNSVMSLGDENEELYTIKGTVPTIDNIGHGCRFYDRCTERLERCKSEVPRMIDINENHSCRCFLVGGE